jgi:hypothetical protein
MESELIITEGDSELSINRSGNYFLVRIVSGEDEDDGREIQLKAEDMLTISKIIDSMCTVLTL